MASANDSRFFVRLSADFFDVTIHCPLTANTRKLIGAAELCAMKRNALRINTARGEIVDDEALLDALCASAIGGAAIDCFEDEPLSEPSRFSEFDNVMLAPHSVAWTRELFRDIGRSACKGIVDLSCGRVPKGVVNGDVLKKASFMTKWERVIGKRPEVAS